jgi:hypothetical protein
MRHVSPAIKSGHVCRRAGFVNEYQTSSIAGRSLAAVTHTDDFRGNRRDKTLATSAQKP